MTRQLLKETRDLRAIFLTSALVILGPYLVWREEVRQFGLFTFALCCAVLAGSSFGGEFQQRTLPLLLSQPIMRTGVWRDKMLVLGGFLVATFLLILLCFALFFQQGLDETGLVTLVLILLCAFCGAPYWTLLCRSGMAGVVFSISAPGGLLALAALIGEYWLQGFRSGKILAFLVLAYCMAFFWLGYRKFMRLQVMDGGSEELRAPRSLESLLARTFNAWLQRAPGPLGNLTHKELRLQIMPLNIAVVFIAIASIGGLLYGRRPELAGGIIAGDFFLYIALLPLLPGALAFAEEKCLGVADWHASLPLTVWSQWLWKTGIALAISVGLGLLLPAAVWQIGRALLDPSAASSIPNARGAILIVLIQVLLSSLAAYWGTVSSGTLKSILCAFAGALVLALCVYGTLGLVFFVYPQLAQIDRSRNLGNWAVAYAGLVVSTALVQLFSFLNYQRRVCGWMRVAGQALALMLIASLFAATAILL